MFDDSLEIREIDSILRANFDVGCLGAYSVGEHRVGRSGRKSATMTPLPRTWAYPHWITANGRDVLATVHRLDDNDEGTALVTDVQRVRIERLLPLRMD